MRAYPGKNLHCLHKQIITVAMVSSQKCISTNITNVSKVVDEQRVQTDKNLKNNYNSDNNNNNSATKSAPAPQGQKEPFRLIHCK